jgi:hypothetical protein
VEFPKGLEGGCMASRSSHNWFLLIVILLIGFIAGTILGEVLRPYLPFMATGATAQMGTQTFRLADAFRLTFGFKIHLNLATIMGVVLAFFLYRRF